MKWSIGMFKKRIRIINYNFWGTKKAPISWDISLYKNNVTQFIKSNNLPYFYA